MKNKAFTLIELLAVIIILGILMLIAIPSVTSYINDSRKNSYVSTINSLIKGTIAKVNDGDYNLTDTETTYYIPSKCIKLENGEAKSPYGNINEAYVVVTFNGNNYNYFYAGKDTQNMGVPVLTSTDILSKESIVADVGEIDTSIGIEGTTNAFVFSSECNGEGESMPVSKTVSGGNSSSGGGTSTTTCERQSCPDVTETIYWALQDTNSDGTNDKLVISDSAISGVLSGSISGNTKYTSWTSVPWGTSLSYLPGEDSKISYVTKIEVIGTVAPVYLDYWFTNVGSNSNTSEFIIDLSGLYTCHTVSMDYAFYHTGKKAQKYEIKNLCKLDISNVTTMYRAFGHSGYDATDWSIGDISNWDTSNVTNMGSLFNCAGYNSKKWEIGDISKWDVSNVTNMAYMFNLASFNVTSSIDWNLNNWNTSNVVSMGGMFSSFGCYAPSINLNLSSWDTSNAKFMACMFSYAGTNSSSFNLNLSGWNTANAQSLFDMFSNTARSATTFMIKIPKTNGGGLNNTDSLLYGNSSSNYIGPPSGRTFTLAN